MLLQTYIIPYIVVSLHRHADELMRTFNCAVPKLLGDSPLWGQVRSPLSPGDWRKLGLTLDEAEEQLLLSGSIDFSPWNTEQLPDIILSQSTKVEDKVVQTATKPSSPARKEAAQPNWSAKNLRLLKLSNYPSTRYFICMLSCCRNF